jgi:hypothetical protein
MAIAPPVRERSGAWADLPTDRGGLTGGTLFRVVRRMAARARRSFGVDRASIVLGAGRPLTFAANGAFIHGSPYSPCMQTPEQHRQRSTRRRRRGDCSRRADELILGEPRLEPLATEQAAQAVELLAGLIVTSARERDVHARQPADDRPIMRSRRGERACQRSAGLANGRTSDRQDCERESGSSTGVSARSRAPDCRGGSRSGRCA